MQRSTDFLDSDLLRLMTTTLDSVVAACIQSHSDPDELRVAAARHIFAAVDAGERCHKRLERAALIHVRSQGDSGPTAEVERWPWAHRNSA
jgi:hypothetical protein